MADPRTPTALDIAEATERLQRRLRAYEALGQLVALDAGETHLAGIERAAFAELLDVVNGAVADSCNALLRAVQASPAQA